MAQIDQARGSIDRDLGPDSAEVRQIVCKARAPHVRCVSGTWMARGRHVSVASSQRVVASGASPLSWHSAGVAVSRGRPRHRLLLPRARPLRNKMLGASGRIGLVASPHLAIRFIWSWSRRSPDNGENAELQTDCPNTAESGRAAEEVKHGQPTLVGCCRPMGAHADIGQRIGQTL